MQKFDGERLREKLGYERSRDELSRDSDMDSVFVTLSSEAKKASNIREGVLSTQDVLAIAADLLDLVIPGRWRETIVTGDGKAARIRHEKIAYMEGVLPLLGSYVITPANERSPKRKLGELCSNINKRVDEIELCVESNPVLASLYQAVRDSYSKTPSTLRAILDVQDSRLLGALAKLFVPILIGVDILREKESLQEYRHRYEALIGECDKGSLRNAVLGLAAYYRGSQASITLSSIEGLRMIGSGLLNNISLHGIEDASLFARGILALQDRKIGQRLMRPLSIYDQEQGVTVSAASREHFKIIGRLVFKDKETARDIQPILSTPPSIRERFELLQWLDEHRDFLPLRKKISGAGADASALNTLLAACQEGDGVAGRLWQECLVAGVRVPRLLKIIQAGKDFVLDGGLRDRVYNLPIHYEPLLVHWSEARRLGETQKASALEQLWDARNFTSEDLTRVMLAISASGDAGLEKILDCVLGKQLRGTALQRNLREFTESSVNPTKSTRLDNVPRVEPRVDPVAVNLRSFGIRHDSIELVNGLIEKCASDHSLRRLVKFVFDEADRKDQALLFKVLLNASDSSWISFFARNRQLRETLGEVFKSNPQKLGLILEQEYNETTKEQVIASLLPMKDNSMLSESSAGPTQQMVERGAVIFGEWRNLKKVLVVGGEYRGDAKSRIEDAIPGITINVVDMASEDTRRSSPYFNRRYDLYVIAATQVSHTFQDLARQSQRRDGAVWHYMKRCSQTVLLDTLRQGYGILIED